MNNLKLNVVYREWRAHFVDADGIPSYLILMAESESAARMSAEKWAEMSEIIFVSVEPV